MSRCKSGPSALSAEVLSKTINYTNAKSTKSQTLPCPGWGGKGQGGFTLTHTLLS